MPYSTPDRGLSKDLWPEISLRPLRSPTDSLRKIWGGISSSETSLEAPWEVPSGKLRTRESGNSLKSFSTSSEPQRSEEHTSELQSVAISYAVFCLKKKNETPREESNKR